MKGGRDNDAMRNKLVVIVLYPRTPIRIITGAITQQQKEKRAGFFSVHLGA